MFILLFYVGLEMPIVGVITIMANVEAAILDQVAWLSFSVQDLSILITITDQIFNK